MDTRDDENDNQSISSLDERKGCRSLLCDANGIIIAEMVYRCMVCYSIHDFIGDISKHYHTVHMNDGEDLEQDEMIKDDEEDQITNNNNNKTNANNSNINNNNNYLTDFSNNFDDTSVWDIDNKFSYNDKVKPTSHSITNATKISNSNNNNSSESCTRSGYIHCPVCSTIRCYTTLQRRYGQFTCVACYRFFKEFFMKPARFSCPYLGQCALDVKSKCKACWILACIKVYTVDGRRKSILEANTPIKSSPPRSTATKTTSSPYSYQNENCKPIKPSHNLSSFPSLNESCSFLLPSLKDSCNFTKDEESTNTSLNQNDPSPGSSLLTCEEEVPNCEEMLMEEDPSTLLMIKDEDDKINGYESSGTSSLTEKPIVNGKTVANNGNNTGAKRNDRRSKARVKNWCCLKCVNCLADDCGKCINCLDRPKFGGPFIRKQRCVNKKCLEKLQSEAK